MYQSKPWRKVFLRKLRLSYSSVLFNNIPKQGTSTQKHLGFYLDKKLNFDTQIKEKIGKATKGIGVIIK